MFKKAYKYLQAIQIDPLLIVRSMSLFVRYLSDKKRFGKATIYNDWPLQVYPILIDRLQQSADLGEYFYQDLFVAKRVIQENPNRHIDVGSRIDCFIAHLACNRPVEVFDIRPLKANIENIRFTQSDITQESKEQTEIADCVSCLHTLEHIGLGRYGDQIDPDGWRKGLASLYNLVKTGGHLWLSVPIGRQRVEFNAHRVFAPKTILVEAEKLGLIIAEFHYFMNQEITQSLDIEKDIIELAKLDYALGIFYFIKKLSIKNEKNS
jgi:hypothetical protein